MIDGGVVEFCKQYLPGISAGAFDDPRLDLVIADGADFMRQNADHYDVIIVDSTGPGRAGRSALHRHLLRAIAGGGNGFCAGAASSSRRTACPSFRVKS